MTEDAPESAAPAQEPQAHRLSVQARAMLDDETFEVGLRLRTAARLTRLALEAAIDDYWERTDPRLRHPVPRRAQFIVLAAEPDLRQLARSAHSTWCSLSRAGHQHPYELTCTIDEISGWMHDVDACIEQFTCTPTRRADPRVPERR